MKEKEPNILVLEDEEIVADFILIHLLQLGFQVTLAGDSESALELLIQDPSKFDTILLDRGPPGVDGLTLLLKLRASPQLAQAPVVMATAMDDPASMLDGLKAGAYYYLTKPFKGNCSRSSSRRRRTNIGNSVACSISRGTAISPINCWISGYSVSAHLNIYPRSQAAWPDCVPTPQRVTLGFHELMVNAIEHGNLGISF